MVYAFKLNQRGNGMIIGFFALTVIFTFAISFLAVTSSSLFSSKRDAIRAKALACAEAGIDQGISFLMEGRPDMDCQYID